MAKTLRDIFKLYQGCIHIASTLEMR
jgi:hypothetical protein